MKNTSNTVRTICEIGIFAALGFVFDEIQGLISANLFPAGGSIGFAMIAVLIIAYRRGFLPALLTGLIMGLFDIATKAYVRHPVQVLLDYVFPYMLVAFAALLKPLFDKAQTKKEKILWLLLGTLIGGLLKLLSHYLAGVFFWVKTADDFSWGIKNMNTLLYCLIYNLAFIGPSIIITGALLVIVYQTYPAILSNKPFVESEENNSRNVLPAVISTCLISGGAFLFVYYLIDWVKSFYYNAGKQKYYFNQDSMVIYVLGIFFVVLGTICLISYFKNKFNYLVMSTTLVVITFVSFAYSIVKVSETIQDKGDPKMYWIWFAVALVGYAGAITFFVLTLINRRNKED